jgi:cytochrome c nitrite reductase small subunit
LGHIHTSMFAWIRHRTLWALGLPVVGLGIAAGLGAFTFVFADGASYLTNDPAACANCHVMNEQYDGWLKSSHHAVAVCNDCHTPPGFIPKYTTKALNGFWHSFYFTTGTYPDPIRITKRNREVTEKACRKCHVEIVHAVDPALSDSDARGNLECLTCHNSVGHPEGLGRADYVWRKSNHE